MMPPATPLLLVAALAFVGVQAVAAEHARGFWGLVTRVLFSWPSLWFMFGYRRWVTRRALEQR